MSTTTAAKPRPQAKVAPDPAMKLTIDRAEFARSLAHATSVVERRNTIPVLSNVLLEAYPDALTNAECAGRSGYSETSGGYKNPRGNLSSLNIITYPSPGSLRAADWLFP